jgi:hypothetical protein
MVINKMGDPGIRGRIILKPILEKEMKCEYVSRIQMVQDRMQGQVFVNMAMKFRIS